MNTVICPRCGTENPASNMNCSKCRVNLPFALEHSDQIEAVRREAARDHSMAPAQAVGSPKYVQVIRWVARLASLLFIGVFVLMFIGEGIDPSKTTPREWVGLFFFPFGAMLGLLVAWWKEGWGSAIALGSLFVNFAVNDVNSAGAGYQLVCVSPAFLFLLCWFIARESGTAARERPA